MARVRRAAEAIGYRRNPVASRVMASLRWPARQCRLTLAALGGAGTAGHASTDKYERLLLLGAQQRASEFGFQLEAMTPKASGLDGGEALRLQSGVDLAGLLLLPSWQPADWPRLEWTRLATVLLEDSAVKPLHSACPNHYNATLAALGQAIARGYRRPGLCVERVHDAQVEHRLTAALRVFQETEPRCAALPPLRLGPAPREEFLDWFGEHAPDVVLGHSTEILQWMRVAGARVPATHGFICLNWLPGDLPCAGQDLRPGAIAVAAVDVLLAQIRHNERGLPANPVSTALPARWVEGPTLRDRVA
jgi:LacI family transcriptional regulator